MNNSGITCNYVLTRIDLKTKLKTVLMQSDDLSELQLLKGKLQSELPLEFYQANFYFTEETPAVTIVEM